MTPDQFVQKWAAVDLPERAASQEHFTDLCRLIGQPTPAEADPTGQSYCFEKSVKVVGAASKGSKGDSGFVDVWKKGCFAWEYKRKDKYKDLDEAYRQLYQYRDALDNPPLSIVCDIRNIVIRTHFSGYPTARIDVKLEELPSRLEILRRLFTSPDSFRPSKTTEKVTLDLAKEFGKLADRLIERYPRTGKDFSQKTGDPVAHFLMKVMFCLFAEGVGLLPAKAFTKIVRRSQEDPDKFAERAAKLFAAMSTGGEYGSDDIPYFNGGLFDDKPPLPLTHGDLTILRWVAEQDWAGVEPSIFGTLFERLLDPKKRTQIGAHYTSKKDIMLVVEPVVITPLRREWQTLLDELKGSLTKHDREPDPRKRDLLSAPMRIRFDEFRRHLGAQRILDPACGSGNFLYVALQQLLDLDDEVVRFAAHHDIALNPRPYIRPVHDSHAQLMGIEINRYAAELAQVVIWIGYLQWLSVRAIDPPHNPILSKLDCIDNRDAILDFIPHAASSVPPSLGTPGDKGDEDRVPKRKEKAVPPRKMPVAASWPEADFIIGNPPFLGGSLVRANLGADYFHALQKAFDLPMTSDLCCYWFELARREIKNNSGSRVGLLATQGIRGHDNRTVLERIKETGDIFMAWSDRPWTLEGAAVNVSIIGFDGGNEQQRTLDAKIVASIYPNLSDRFDATAVANLPENLGIQHEGDKKGAVFEIEMETARHFLASPNVAKRSILDVCRPWFNGAEANGRYQGMWIADFPPETSEAEAAQFDMLFKYVVSNVRGKYGDKRKEWWIHERPRPAMRAAIKDIPRFFVTTRHSKHRMFCWVSNPALPDSAVIVFARADDYFFGVLQSSLHIFWALRMGTQLEDRPRYTPTTCFETFPLPWPPGKEDFKHPVHARISSAAKELNELRERWLNPPEWIELVAARVDARDNFSDVPKEARALIRQSAIMAEAAKDSRLKKRTLTNLYNERPAWLRIAHEKLDRAVLAAYAAVDPKGSWTEDWAEVWTETGAGHPLPADHPLKSRRAEIDQKVLENLLRLNHLRAANPP